MYERKRRRRVRGGKEKLWRQNGRDEIGEKMEIEVERKGDRSGKRI